MKIFNFRYWSLLLVVPSAGLLLLVLITPLFISALGAPIYPKWDAIFLKKLLASWHLIFEIENLYDLPPRILAATSLGLVIQAIAAAFWNQSHCAISCAFDDNFQCEKNAKCPRMSEGNKALKYFYSGILVKIFPCEECLHFSDNDKLCMTDTQEYAGLQSYLEHNKEDASYVEWEKFLSSLYEYLSVVAVLALFSYLGYCISSIIFVIPGVVDFTLITFIILISIFLAVFLNASYVHRKGYSAARQIAYAHYCRSASAVDAGSGREPEKIAITGREHFLAHNGISASRKKRRPRYLEALRGAKSRMS